MHGQHRGDRQQKWHMWPGPSQRSPLGTDADSACVKCFSKAGRKIGVGDCALFQAGNAPPFIGIIRKLIEEKESSLKLSVNWLYRPGDIKLGKGASLEAAPNEIFYSFHKDEISAASLLHPCKVAFLQKGVELPAGVSSFVCRRVYDTANRCLYWLTDQDYTDERQAEVDQLLDRTKHEMQPAAQSEGPSQRASSAPISSKPEIVNAAPPGQGKGKKRERTDQNLDPSKRERLMKVEDSESKRECTMRFEDFSAIAEKDGGLINVSYVDQLVQVMLQERNESVKKLGDVVSRRTLLASIIAATEKEDCLTHFVQLGGLPVLDDWLQEAHKGKLGDGSPKDGDKGLEELLLTLLRALDKLPVDLDALKTCIVGKSVNNLRSHRNSEIQKKARKLVDTWKKRVDAEMKSSDEVKSGLNTVTTWSSKPASETHSTKGRSAGSSKSSAAMKLAMNGSAPSGDTKCNLSSVSGYKEHPGITMSKDNSVKLHVSGASEMLAVVKEEKSCSSSQSQNNSQSWCSGSGKGVGSWKEEVKALSVASQGNKTMGTTLRSHSHSTKSPPTASSTGFQKESTGRHKISGIEKMMSSAALLDKVPGEGARAENSNSQRLIVRLPNPGRSPAHSISGGSLVDGGAANNRGSSPGSTDRHDSLNGRSRAPAVHSPDTSGDAKCGNCNANGGKSGADCKEEIDRSCVATADGVDCKSPDVEHKPKDHLTGKGSSDVHMGIVKKGTAASVTTATPVSSNMSPEGLGLDTVEGGIDLLASVAACEGSETEKSFSGSTGGEGHPPSADGNRDSAIQGRVLNETEFKNQGYKDGEKQKQDGLTKGSLEPVAMCVRESSPVQDYTELADASKEGPMISAVEKVLGESVIDGATEMLSLDSFAGKEVNAPAAWGSEADVIQDGYGGAKLITGEATDDEKESMSRLSAGICNGSSLTGECQTAPTSSLDNVASLEEGSEDGRKNALARVPLTCLKTGDFISGYYEEDALEVARQVAKEVEQEVEGYGKPEAQDANSISPCENDSKSERPDPENLKANQTLPGDADTSVKDVGGERLTTDATHADASVETFTERREETDADRPPFTREKEVDHSSSHLNDEENMRPDLEPALDSVDDTKEVSKVEEHIHSPPATVPEESVTTTPEIAPSMEASVPDEGATLSKDRKSGSKDIERPVFDLNEGLVIDEVLHDHDPHCTVSASGLAAVIAPDSASGLPAQPSSLAAPIAVVSATKGAFIPPSNLLRTKGELGWKGSAATSAFRPAEPRRMAETLQPPLDTTATTLATTDSTGQNGKQARFLDIDLNVADERVMEDSVMASSLAVGSVCQLPVGSVNESFNANNSTTASRPELDLNRVDESDESMGPLMSISRDADEFNSRLPLTATRVMLDFDLNDGLGFEEAGMEEVSSQHKNHKNLESSSIPVLAGRRPNLEFVNVAPWYSAASSVPAAMVIPAFSANKSESSYPVVAGPSAKSVITTGHNLGPFSADPYPGGSAMPSSAVPYTSTVPASFSYAGLPFGAGFPFSSASYNVSSAPHVSSTNSLPFLAAAPSQLVSAGAVVSPYGRPYLMGRIGEVPGADSSASWARPSLDLNAGPDVAADSDARDEGFSTRPAAGFSQLSYQQAGSSGGTLKRKEPEGGFDPYRSGFKQMTWR